MVEGHRCPQECCVHSKMYLEKGESKHILMVWCVIFFVMVMQFEKGNGGLPISVSTPSMNQMDFKFSGWNTWCHYPKKRIWR